MRNDTTLNGKLYGIGIGPGDPKLLTLKAKEILERVDTIFVPKGREESSSYAYSIIKDIIPAKKSIVELVFPMTRNKDVLKAHWQAAGQRIVQALRKGKEAAFVTIGDPFIYSTYVYLLKTLSNNFPQTEVETIPGISSFNAAACKAGFPLVERDERLAILPVSRDLKGIREALDDFDTVVLMKVGSKLEKVMRLLKKTGLAKNSVLVSRLGQSNEVILRDISSLKDKRLGYLSVIIVKCKKRNVFKW